MKKIVFTEEFCSPENLFPFTLTRQMQDLRVGILTIREKWEALLEMPSFDKQEGDYKDLDRSLDVEKTIGNAIVYLIHGNILPTPKLVEAIKALHPGESISLAEGENIVYCISAAQIIDENKIEVDKAIPFLDEVKNIHFPWDLVRLNAWALAQDVALLRQTKVFQRPAKNNQLRNPQNIFIEEGADVEFCFINANEGPVYIAKGAIVMEGSLLRGPLSIGEGAVVKMGTKIYGATTVGPYCTVGGEVKNTIFFNHSNKAHDGYVGDAVIGAWCNLGAGTSASNVKNNAGAISIQTPTGVQHVGLKCGVLMGDYSRTAINTSINTGTVIGVCCNVFGAGLTPKQIPSFSWGADGIQRYQFDKAIEHIANWKRLKKETLTEGETGILAHIFDHY